MGMFQAFVFILFSLSCSLSSRAEAGEERNRRSVLNFGKMIFAAIGRNPLDYNGYGCHCGLGGHGEPLDDVDRCCQTHDQCYNKLKKGKICSGLGIYLEHYKTSSPLECAKTNSECGKGLCECDRDAVLCFQQKEYNKKYKNYNKLRCFF